MSILIKLTVIAVILFILESIVGNLLYLNPASVKFSRRFEGHQAVKPPEEVGGMGRFIGLNMGLGLFLTVVFVLAYYFIHPVLPSTPAAAGLIFAAGLIMVKILPEAFNQWLISRYPGGMIKLQLMNSAISALFTGLCLGYCFHLFRL